MIKNTICFIIIIGFLVLPVLVLAQHGGEGSGFLQNPLKYKTFGELIKAITSIVIKIGTALAVIFIIYSGFLFVTARGNETQLEKAKTTFTWTVIGTAVLVGAAVIAEAVVNFVNKL